MEFDTQEKKEGRIPTTTPLIFLIQTHNQHSLAGSRNEITILNWITSALKPTVPKT